MKYVPKVLSVLSYGFLLCLGLSTVAEADYATSTADKLKADQSDRRQGGQAVGEKQMTDRQGGQPTGAKTIMGEVVRVEGNDCFVKEQDGKEVRLHIDVTTLKAKNIEPGDRIEVKVNDQNHALSVLSGAEIQDRRNAKD